MFGVLLWIGFSAVVGWAARERRRDPWLWGLLALVVSPLVAYLLLLVVEEATGG